MRRCTVCQSESFDSFNVGEFKAEKKKLNSKGEKNEKDELMCVGGGVDSFGFSGSFWS
jgi:hypothetical protein